MSASAASARFDRFRSEFLGLGSEDPVAVLDGEPARKRRVYLDTGATALMPRLLQEALQRYGCDALANSHSSSHRAARVTTREIRQARESVARLMRAHPARHVTLFTGNGATHALNLLADALFPAEVRLLLRGARTRDAGLRGLYGELRAAAKERGVDAGALLERDLVVVSRLEHHSNILPWMRAVGSRNLRFPQLTADGSLDLDDLQRILETEGARVRLVAVTGCSNVTGVMPPVRRIAAIAHAAGAEIVVDAAQWAPHAPIVMHDPADEAGDIDHLALSGHKLYAPGSRGVLVARRDVFPGPEAVGVVGGGMADVVSLEGYSALPEVTQREEGGTPNLPGSIGLGIVAQALSSFGMELVAEHERELVALAFTRLPRIEGLRIYGPDPARAPRAAVFAFNVEGLPHPFLAAALSDFCNIAVRNSSFCAQPYVRHLLGGGAEDALMEHVEGSGCGTLPGMVRASGGIYTNADDLLALEDGIRWVQANADRIASCYDTGPGGELVHKTFAPDCGFGIQSEIERYFAAR